MIKRLLTSKQREVLKKKKLDQNLLKKLTILLIKKGIISKEDYENLQKE